MQKVSPILPIVLLLSLLALLAGLWAGLLRLGWQLPDLQINLPPAHGPLMVSGFLGTVIALERVVALKKGWMYTAPLLTGLGWVFSLALPGTAIGTLLITLGSLGLVIILGVMIRREPALHVITIGVGTLCWFIGNLLWLSGFAIYQIVFWWAAFLILTITGERLELSRVLHMTRLKQILFLLSAGLFLAGVILGMIASQPGARLAGLGMLGLALWLLWFDLARRNLRHRIPLTRYIARCLYAGYFWLGFGGIFCLCQGIVFAGPAYDAVLHSVFIGFVISMIFGHAPIILPALLNRMLPYHPSFYLSLVLLHTSLLMRIAGDLGGWYRLRQWGGLLNEISILLFLVILVVTLRSQSRQKAGVRS
ncbi:MAG TPA: hypothetical protein VF313_07090 [Anaerolineaceae bacterium]